MAHRLRKAVGDCAVQQSQGGGHQSPENARPELPQRFVNGDDAAHFQRLLPSRLRLRKDFKLGLHHLQVSAAERVKFNFAVKENALARPEDLLPFQVKGVEPFAPEHAAGIGGAQVVNMKAPPGPQETTGQDIGQDGGGLSGDQVADGSQTRAVFVAERRVVEEVFHRADAARGQNFRPRRANALQVLDFRSQRQLGSGHPASVCLL